MMSHCKRRPAPASNIKRRGTRSTSTKEREMVSFMHPPPSNAHHCLAIIFNTERPTETEGTHYCLAIVDVYFNTERPIKARGDETLGLKSTISSQRLQGTLLTHVIWMATIDYLLPIANCIIVHSTFSTIHVIPGKSMCATRYLFAMYNIHMEYYA